MLREEWDYIRELVERIQFEIWNNAKIPNLNFIFLKSKVNFLAAAGQRRTKEVFCLFVCLFVCFVLSCGNLFQVRSNVFITTQITSYSVNMSPSALAPL